MSENVLEVIKRGETSLTVSLVRSGGGLTVSVKAHPAVEAFMRGLGSGELVNVRAAGPYWRPVSRDGLPELQVYAMNEAIPNLTLDSQNICGVSRPSQPMIEVHTDPGSGRIRSNINLSFLRLAGISEDAGVTFAVRGVHTYEALTKMREQIGEAYKLFYRTYMKPIKMDVIVSTQETSL